MNERIEKLEAQMFYVFVILIVMVVGNLIDHLI